MDKPIPPPCEHSNLMNPYQCEPCARIEELEDRIFKIKQIGDKLFMHANFIPTKDRTKELDDAIMGWASVHCGEV